MSNTKKYFLKKEMFYSSSKKPSISLNSSLSNYVKNNERVYFTNTSLFKNSDRPESLMSRAHETFAKSEIDKISLKKKSIEDDDDVMLAN